MASLRFCWPAILLAACGVPRPDDSGDAAVPLSGESTSQPASAFLTASEVDAGVEADGAAGERTDVGRDWGFVQSLAASESTTFGRSVALSASWAAIGAPAASTAQQPTAVCVYTLREQEWQRAVELAPPARDAGGFGSSLAIGDDIIVVGAPQADLDASGEIAFEIGVDREAISRAGAVYVFTRSQDGFVLSDELRAPVSQAWQGFGAALALDGDHLVVGAPDRDQGGLDDAGAAFVFARVDGHFVLSGELAAPVPAAGDGFGRALALLGDTLAVGASLRDEHGQGNTGAAYVFGRAGTTFTLRQTVVPNAQKDGLFGASIALSYTSGLRQRLVVGAPGVDVAEQARAGMVFVFDRPEAGAFAEQARLSSNAPGADAGFGVSVAQDRAWLLVGSQGDLARTPPEVFASSVDGLVHHSLLSPPAGMGPSATNGPIALAQGNLLWSIEDDPGLNEPSTEPRGTVHAFHLID